MFGVIRYWLTSDYRRMKRRLRSAGTDELTQLEAYISFAPEFNEVERSSLLAEAHRQLGWTPRQAVADNTASSGVWKTTIEVTILSSGPYDPDSLDDIHRNIAYGGVMGRWHVTSSRAVAAGRLAAECEALGGEPSFFEAE